jgi:hypothetical protein
MNSDAETYILDLEKKLLLPTGFFESMLAEDDWSFVIKIHALFEAALSQLLAHHLGRPELLDVLCRMEISNTATGKLAVAKALGYLEDEERKVIRSWSELRNMMVHDVTNTSFNFKAHITLLSPKDQKQFLRRFYMEEWYQPNIEKDEGFAEAVDDPKKYFYNGALSLLSQLSSYFLWADWDRELEHRKWLERMMSDHFGDSADQAV